MKNKGKICILTLGCKVNQYESNSLEEALQKNGFDVTQTLEPADAYFINTCAVTNEAERKSRGMIAKIKKVNLAAPIYVAGCSSQHNPDIFKKYENVRVIYGTSSKYEIINLIKNDLQSGNLKAVPIVHSTISKTYEDKYLAKGERTRVVIKIQEGCNNFCSYCLIPYLRGRERSRSLESVKNEVLYQSKICKEIIFTGINLSAYGKDLDGPISLKDIAIMMQDFPEVRFRFSSLEQDIITDDFLKILCQTKNFCPHFHLSLQSGSDRTLKNMNRKYDSKTYYEKVKLIRKYFDNPSITTDIIVGFPTETEEDFIDSYNFAKKCKFSKMHIFPYSLRSGTAAAKMKNIATNVKERVAKLSCLDKELFNSYITQNLGKTLSIIVETKDENYYIGHSENYIKCYIESKNALKQNDIVLVTPTKIYKDGAICKIVSC